MRSLLFLLAISCYGQTCSPVSFSAVTVQGQTFQSAITNGVQSSNIGKTAALFQWTSDAATHPATVGNYAIYVTDAQWVSNGNSFGASPNKTYTQAVPVTANNTLQGAILTNLIPNTVYHVAGQTVTAAGTCPSSGTVTTFTTNPWNGVTPPTAPSTFDTSEPTITGTDRVLGVSPCVATGTPGAGGYVGALQACLNVSQPGDGINMPSAWMETLYGATPLTFPYAGQYASPYSFAVTLNTGTNTFTLASGTVAGLGWSNGTQLQIGGFQTPSPVNAGCNPCYSIVNASGATFQLSLDGTNPITFLDGGIAPLFAMKWPITASWIVIHSGVGATNLPPGGVRLDPVAYGTKLGVIQMADPTAFINVGFSARYRFDNVEWVTAPSAATNETNPTGYTLFFKLNPGASNWVFNQNWFHPAPAPDRIANAAIVGGNDIAFLNSYLDNNGWWKVTAYPYIASTAGTLTVATGASTYNYVVSGNNNATCALGSHTLTVAGTGSADLQFKIYMALPGCALHAVGQTGLTLTGSGFTIDSTTGGIPPYPTDGNGVLDVIPVGAGQWFHTPNNIGYADDVSGNGITANATNGGISESNTGVQLTSAPGNGPFEFINSAYYGEGIVGLPFLDANFGSACPGGVTCPQVYNTIDLTVQRNLIAWDPKFIFGGAGALNIYAYGRNLNEYKQGSRIAIKGNILGPSYAGLAGGECLDLFEYYNDVPAGLLSVPNTQSTSDVNVESNTCIANEGPAGGYDSGIIAPNLMRRIRFHNNLVFSNSYTYNPNPTQNSAFYGLGLALNASEDLEIDHNLWWQTAGYYTPSFEILQQPFGGFDYSNNINWYDTDQAFQGLYYGNGGSCSSGATGTCAFPDLNAQVGSALLANLNQATMNNNAWLCGYSNSAPASQIAISQANCTTYAALYPGNNFFPNTVSTLAGRINQIQLYSAGTYSSPQSGTYYLQPGSPINSGGANKASDGKQVGPNINELNAAQGLVQNIHVSALGTTTASITFQAPDSFVCIVDVKNSNDFILGTAARSTSTPFTPTITATVASGQTIQTASITGLTSATLEYGRVNCAVSQPVITFTTH
jgi:hypothetical protein